MTKTLQAIRERMKKPKTLPHKPQKSSIMYGLCKEIYDRFDLNEKKVPATRFQDLKDIHSPPTIIKAKKILGIRSIRVEDLWYWLVPLYTYDEKLDAYHRQYVEELAAQSQDHLKPSTEILETIMREHKFDILANVAVSLMKEKGYTKGTVVKRKALLGIYSHKVLNEWHWVLPHQEVQAWLKRTLDNGPVEIEYLFNLAEKEGYTRDLIIVTRQMIGILAIPSVVVRSKVCWSMSPADRELSIQELDIP